MPADSRLEMSLYPLRNLTCFAAVWSRKWLKTKLLLKENHHLLETKKATKLIPENSSLPFYQNLITFMHPSAEKIMLTFFLRWIKYNFGMPKENSVPYQESSLTCNFKQCRLLSTGFYYIMTVLQLCSCCNYLLLAYKISSYLLYRFPPPPHTRVNALDHSKWEAIGLSLMKWWNFGEWVAMRTTTIFCPQESMHFASSGIEHNEGCVENFQFMCHFCSVSYEQQKYLRFSFDSPLCL